MKQVTYNTFIGFINTQSQLKLVTVKNDDRIVRAYFNRDGHMVATWIHDGSNDICEVID